MSMLDHASRYHPNFNMLMCELMAILIVKFNAFAAGFAKDPDPDQIIQVWDLIPWHEKPEKKKKHNLYPFMD